GTSIAHIVLFDFSVDVSGAILLASAVLLVAGAALTPIGSEWTALLGVVVVSASAPSLRWAALGALIAVATVQAKEGEHLAWIAALGAVLLVARMVLAWLIDRSGRSAIVRDQLLFALLLLGISARDSLGLGTLAVALLLIDLAIVRIEVMPERWSGTAARLVLLARSNWPPAVTFAGASMAVIATLQASLGLGLLAA